MAASSSLPQLLSLLFLALFFYPNVVCAQSSSPTSQPSTSPSTISTLSSTSPSNSSSLAPPTTLAATQTAAAPPSTTSLNIISSTAGYTYYGCWNETTGNASAGNARALPQQLNTPDPMTVALCMQYGHTLGSTYCGLEYGRECWCGTTLNYYSVKLPDASCDLECTGDNGTACGGEWRLDVYKMSSGAGKLEIGWGVGVAVVLGLVIAYVVLV